MPDKTVNKEFQLVGIKGNGPFEDFGTIVPDVAREVMARFGEIGPAPTGEISLFEPKAGSDHLQGEFIAGLMVGKPVRNAPVGMVYVEIEGNYATDRGNIEDVKNLHADLLKWTADNGYQIDRKAYIVEIYLPGNSGEVVEIYLPILSS